MRNTIRIVCDIFLFVGWTDKHFLLYPWPIVKMRFFFPSYVIHNIQRKFWLILGKKGKKSKGKTVALTEFLAPSWSDEVDEADKLGDSYRKPALPAAPRAARVADIDEKIPKNPPFIAYLSNLSYEVEEEDIQNFFDEYNVST